MNLLQWRSRQAGIQMLAGKPLFHKALLVCLFYGQSTFFALAPRVKAALESRFPTELSTEILGNPRKSIKINDLMNHPELAPESVRMAAGDSYRTAAAGHPAPLTAGL
jgi:hypothetical protein